MGINQRNKLNMIITLAQNTVFKTINVIEITPRAISTTPVFLFDDSSKPGSYLPYDVVQRQKAILQSRLDVGNK